jgi:siderophore synthetase component
MDRNKMKDDEEMSRKVFDHVSRKRLAAMKAIMRRRISAYARENGYEIQTWHVPEAADSVWHVVLRSKKGKPKLDFMARVQHDSTAQRLTIAMMRKPWFVTYESALAQLQSVYKATRS